MPFSNSERGEDELEVESVSEARIEFQSAPLHSLRLARNSLVCFVKAEDAED